VAELDGGVCDGTPRVISPEVQLLQKIKSPRDKDEVDFLAVRHLLPPDPREWLTGPWR
jgi:hypothetical protein